MKLPPKKSKINELRRQLAVEEGKQSRQTAARLTALEKTLPRQERVVTTLQKRVAKLEARAIKLHNQLRGLRKRKNGRTRKSHIDHRISQTEKVHLLKVWMDYKNHPKALEREGKKLAKRYKLDYQRQIQVWFRFFRRMTAAERKKLS